CANSTTPGGQTNWRMVRSGAWCSARMPPFVAVDNARSISSGCDTARSTTAFTASAGCVSVSAARQAATNSSTSNIETPFGVRESTSGGDADFHGVPDVARRASDADVVPPRVDVPATRRRGLRLREHEEGKRLARGRLVDRGLPVCERARPELERHGRTLAGAQRDLRERGELLRRTSDARVARCHVTLHDFATRACADVGHVDVDGYG